MNIEEVQLDKLIAIPEHSRSYSEDALTGLMVSMNRFGIVQPVVWNRTTGHIVGGHMRVDALRREGRTECQAVVVEMDRTREKELYITLNNRRIQGDWTVAVRELIDQVQASMPDEDAIALRIAALKEDVDKKKLQGDEEEKKGNKDPDEVPKERKIPAISQGDLILLGEHRLFCGSSTSKDDVDALMDRPIDMVWTDPPYNVDYEGQDGMKIQNDNLTDDKFRQLLLDAFSLAFQHAGKGTPIYIAHSDAEWKNFRTTMVQAGWNLKQCLVWCKQNFVLGRQDYKWQHEPILYGWKPGSAHRWYGDFDKSTVLDEEANPSKLSKAQLIKLVQDQRNARNTDVVRVDKPSSSGLHPTMKPVKLIQYFLRNSSRAGDIVYDPFGGSGSTLIACETLGRHARLMELDPVYCDVIVRRWEDFTGLKAKCA